jgi:hypothetical protein
MDPTNFELIHLAPVTKESQSEYLPEIFILTEVRLMDGPQTQVQVYLPTPQSFFSSVVASESVSCHLLLLKVVLGTWK